MKPPNLKTAYINVWMYLGHRYPYMPRKHMFPWSVSYVTYLHSLPGYIQLEKSLSLLMIERCSPVLNFIMLSRFHCQEWLNTCRQDIETPTFKKHVLSDLGPFESFVNTGTFPEQIAIIEMFFKFRRFPYCACLQRANSSRGIIE